METALWHPFANMGRVQEHATTIVRGEGAVVWDDAGRVLLFLHVGDEVARGTLVQTRIS